MGKSKPDVEYVDELEKIKVAGYYLGDVGFELMESTSPGRMMTNQIEESSQEKWIAVKNVINSIIR